MLQKTQQVENKYNFMNFSPHQKSIYYKCRKCSDEIVWNTHKKLIFCSCKSIGVDGCKEYVRLIGNEEDIEVINKVHSL